MNMREEVDALINRNTEVKKNSEALHEKLVYTERDKNKLATELEELKEYTKSVERERDSIKDKIAEAAFKFEETFTKQEDV